MMLRSRKTRWKRGSRFRFKSQRISTQVIKIIRTVNNDGNHCVCGCDRRIKSVQSLLLTDYYCSKSRWMRLLEVRMRRVSDLEEVSTMIAYNGFFEHVFNSLDLYFVKSDLKRQPWLNNEILMDIAEKAIYTFCLYNNVPYWQGIHDVVSALVHLHPTPSVAEVAAIMEQLFTKFAPFIFSQTSQLVSSKANQLAFQFRLLFKYFFPKFLNSFEQICDFSFCAGWFITLGFYRFGCAFISLSYCFLLLISVSDGQSAFILRELAYIATRGYINYLLKNKVSVDFTNSVLLSNYSSSSLIISSILNSNKIHLEPEEFINSSKNLYDSIKDKQLELSEFPLLYILKTTALLFTCTPDVNNIDETRLLLEFTSLDIFPSHKSINLSEWQINTSNKLNCTRRYMSKRYKRNISLPHRKLESSLSDIVNAEILFQHISLLEQLSNYKVHNDKEHDVTNFGNVAYSSIIYNIIDVKSAYLNSGIGLDKIFGHKNTNFLTNIDANNDFTFMDTNFLLWIIMTDDGFDTGIDQYSVDSLERGIDIMERLHNNSTTCVSIFKGGYKGLLKSLNATIPQPPSFLSRISVRRLIHWEPNQQLAPSPKNLYNIASSVVSSAINIENKIVKGISDIRLFKPRQIHHTSPTHHPIQEAVEYKTEYRTGRVARILYYIKVTSASGVEVSLRYNGRIKINGMILHPSRYSNAVTDTNTNTLICISTFFTINFVDGILDLEPLSYSSFKLNTRLNSFFKHQRQLFSSRYMVLFSPNPPLFYHPSIPLLTNVVGVVSNVKLLGLQKLWYVMLIKRKMILNHVLFSGLEYKDFDGKTPDSEDPVNEELFVDIGDLNINVVHVYEPRNVKVFSRTNTSRTRSSRQSSHSSFPTHILMTPHVQMPFKHNPNVFVSRSSLNKRQNTK